MAGSRAQPADGGARVASSPGEIALGVGGTVFTAPILPACVQPPSAPGAEPIIAAMESKGGAGKGLLLATMEPPANIEEEFQDWYDTEHFPERQTCAGFETARRFVCVDEIGR